MFTKATTTTATPFFKGPAPMTLMLSPEVLAAPAIEPQIQMLLPNLVQMSDPMPDQTTEKPSFKPWFRKFFRNFNALVKNEKLF